MYILLAVSSLFHLFLVVEDQSVTQQINENEDMENSVNHETGK